MLPEKLLARNVYLFKGSQISQLLFPVIDDFPTSSFVRSPFLLFLPFSPFFERGRDARPPLHWMRRNFLSLFSTPFFNLLWSLSFFFGGNGIFALFFLGELSLFPKISPSLISPFPGCLFVTFPGDGRLFPSSSQLTFSPWVRRIRPSPTRNPFPIGSLPFLGGTFLPP